MNTMDKKTGNDINNSTINETSNDPTGKTSLNPIDDNNNTAENANSIDSKRGGKRAGSGRPTGSGKYGEPTKAIRVPEGSVSYIKQFLDQGYQQLDKNTASNQQKADVTLINSSFDWTFADPNTAANIPLYSTKVAAGIPTAADDHLEDSLDLNEYLVAHPSSTFMLKVEGESMKDAGILPDDVLIVDRSEKARHNKIVIAALDGELTVKRLYRRAGELKLLPENPDYPEIEIRREADLVIWGVVVGSFRRFHSHRFI